MTRLEFATTTFALSFGLVIGFGIPYSIMSPIILVHSLWLGTDVIGIFFPAKNIEKWYLDKESMIGAGLSVLVGGLYGVLLLAGLQGFVNMMAEYFRPGYFCVYCIPMCCDYYGLRLEKGSCIAGCICVASADHGIYRKRRYC